MENCCDSSDIYGLCSASCVNFLGPVMRLGWWPYEWERECPVDLALLQLQIQISLCFLPFCLFKFKRRLSPWQARLLACGGARILSNDRVAVMIKSFGWHSLINTKQNQEWSWIWIDWEFRQCLVCLCWSPWMLLKIKTINQDRSLERKTLKGKQMRSEYEYLLIKDPLAAE